MMKLSTKGRYGARVMLELALNYNRGPVLLKDIARSQEISAGYLEHLLPPLKTAGLINSSRGAHGGYVLAKAPSAITLGNVIQALEGNLAIVECVIAPEVCPKADLCVARDIWEEIRLKVKEMLDSITLDSMVKRYREKQVLQPLTYSI